MIANFRQNTRIDESTDNQTHIRYMCQGDYAAFMHLSIIGA